EVSPAIARRSVVFPAPFGPASASRSRRSTLNETPSNSGSPDSSFRSWVAIRTAIPGIVEPRGECRRRTALDRHDPHALDGRRAAGERRAPRHRDGARAARLPALHRGDAARAGGPPLARPRPLRPQRRPRLRPPVLRAPPDRLRAPARRAEALPAVGVD